MDIYFEPEYTKLNEFIEDGKAQTFIFESPNGKVIYNYMLRDIEGSDYHDIRTPYGYGGPLITELSGNKDMLVHEYMQAFKDHCANQKIVSEFIRFSPTEKNGDDFSSVMEVEAIRPTVATFFKPNEDVFSAEFHKSARKTCNRSLNKGLRYEVIEKPDNLDTFMKVYYDTMDRNEAAEDYYFSREYFSYMIQKFKDNLLNIHVYHPDGMVIASGLYFVYGTKMHAHLSGTMHEYLALNPAYLLKYATAEWGSAHGMQFIHYGGGTSNDPEDKLLQFKKKFTKSDLLTFQIGKNIYLPDVYEELCEGKALKLGYFPAYRS